MRVYKPFPVFRIHLLFALLMLITEGLCAQPFPITALQETGPKSNRINLVYLSDGYQAAELPAYITFATSVNARMMSEAPFAQYKSFFNVYAIQVPSPESGAKHPGTAYDEATSGGGPITNPNTYFSTTFDYSGIHRAMGPLDKTRVTYTLWNHVPEYTLVVILANSTMYGGANGPWVTISANAQSGLTVTHEEGHALASLADEYWTGSGGEYRNMTRNNDPATVKWKNWMGIGGVGIFPYGASGSAATWYKPHSQCMMQFLGYPFCNVCKEALVNAIHGYVHMIDSYSPAATSFTLAGNSPVNFQVNHLQTADSTITVKWYLNSSTTPFDTGSAVNVPYDLLVAGANTVQAVVTDTTSFSKNGSYGYVNSVSWTVTKNVILPIRLTLSGKTFNNRNVLSWHAEGDDHSGKSFVVEKSYDGVQFKPVATVASVSSVNDYNYADPEVAPPIAFYRVSVKSNGNTDKSGVVELKSAFRTSQYKLYQDVANRRYLFIYKGDMNGENQASIRITNAAGMEILNKKIKAEGSYINYDFNLSGQPAGVYFLNMYIGKEVYLARLVIQ